MASLEVVNMACPITSSLVHVWPKMETRSKALKMYYGLEVHVILFIYAL